MRQIVCLLCASPDLQWSLSRRFLHPNRIWFALSRRSTLDGNVKKGLESAGQVITVYKKGLLVAASRGSFRSGKLRAIQNKEDWILWASKAAIHGEEGGCKDGIGQVDPMNEAILDAQGSVGGTQGTQIRLHATGHDYGNKQTWCGG